jgi:hypothetical protein
MPYIKATTNILVTEDKKKELKADFGRLIEVIPGKTERWLMVAIEDGTYMAMGGDDSPTLMLEVDLLGTASRETYDAFTRESCALISERLGIASERIYVKYKEFSVWGAGGVNF